MAHPRALAHLEHHVVQPQDPIVLHPSPGLLVQGPQRLVPDPGQIADPSAHPRPFLHRKPRGPVFPELLRLRHGQPSFPGRLGHFVPVRSPVQRHLVRDARFVQGRVQGCEDFFAVVQTPGLVDREEDVRGPERLSEGEDGVAPVGAQDGFGGPVDGGYEDLVIGVEGRDGRGGRQVELSPYAERLEDGP